MLIKLIRNEPEGLNIFGRMIIDGGMLYMDTLEHLDYAIPDGFYRVRLTQSARFGELLPILDGVFGYQKTTRKLKQQEESLKQQRQQLNPTTCAQINILGRSRGGSFNDNTDNLRGNQLPAALQEESIPSEQFFSSRSQGVDCERNIVDIVVKKNTPVVVKNSPPVVDSYPRRTGIRIHAGNTIEHTRGCILVGDADLPCPRLLSSKKRLSELINYLLNYQKLNPHEEIYIDIQTPDPYPLADTPYPAEA